MTTIKVNIIFYIMFKDFIKIIFGIVTFCFQKNLFLKLISYLMEFNFTQVYK